jgi:phosphatidylinositol alpha-mannosyltransferase
VGRTSDERKGFDYLLAAVVRSRQLGIDVELHVVGEQEPQMVRRLPHYVTHHGPLSEAELSVQYRTCDVFVAPSTGQESFGLVLLEAMSAARPIICSDIEGYRRVANPNGTQWVPPRCAELLSDAIAALAAQPERRRKMGESNAKYVKRFEWSLITPRIREEYLRTIADCQRARKTMFHPAERTQTFALWPPASEEGESILDPPNQVAGDV